MAINRSCEKAVSIERVKALIQYDPETGDFRWRQSRGTRKAGAIAGTVHRQKQRFYREIKIDRVTIKAHRIAWALHFGDWPRDDIDHIDGNGLNNCIANLRDVPRALNARNAKRSLSNTSGRTGVRFDTKMQKWHARITVDGKHKSLGVFISFEEASAARSAAESMHAFHTNHGRAA